MITSKAQSYSQSLFSISPTKDVLNEILTLKEVFADASVKMFLESEIIKSKDKKQALSSIFKSEPLVKNFIFLLIDNKVTGLLPEICEAFSKLLDEQAGVEPCHIETSEPLAEEQKKSLKNYLEKYLGRQVFLKEEVTPKNLQGIYVKSQDYIFNDTIKFHLEKFENKGE